MGNNEIKFLQKQREVQSPKKYHLVKFFKTHQGGVVNAAINMYLYVNFVYNICKNTENINKIKFENKTTQNAFSYELLRIRNTRNNQH